MRAVDLQVNHMTAPVGIGVSPLRFSWIPVDGERQSAYQVRVLTPDGQLFADSGKRQGQETAWECPAEVPSRRRLHWQVTLWDENGLESDAAESFFETGITKDEWKAEWIDPERSLDPEQRQPASYLRKRFSLEKTGNARLYITCHGIVNAYLNGREVTDHCYLPGTSQYDKRLTVDTLDVTPFLREGENELLLTLGDGWYRGSVANDMVVNTFGTDIALLAQLEVDGVPVVVTDGSWQASQNGPLRENDHMMGETYDARKENITDWHCVREAAYGYQNLICRDTVPMRPQEAFIAKLMTTPAGETVLDFGQNLTGVVYFRLNAHDGDMLILTHGEVLDENGNFTIDNFQNPKKPECYQQVRYTCKEGVNTYHPTKCYFGFRYVKVEASFPITGEEFTARAIYSDMAQTGWFECGDARVNQLFSNALWSMKGNFQDVPTDCPTREKNGYSGDCNTFIHTAMYLMDCYSVIAKWLREQCATQYEDGCISQTAPNKQGRRMMDGGVGWCDSIEILPWKLYERCGDPSAIRECYDTAARWMTYNGKKTEKTHLWNRFRIPKRLHPYFMDHGFLWGEWMEPGVDVVKYMTKNMVLGEPEVSTAYFCYGNTLMARMAKLLGREADASRYADAAEKSREAYRRAFVKKGLIKSGRQCRYVRPIALDLLPEEEKKTNAAVLARKVKENGDHLNTGFLSTHELCRVLTDHGQAKTAYDLLLQEACPGWLYPISQGATTIWEQWDGVDSEGKPHGSHNHYSYGAIVGWLFDRVCGIVVENGQLTIRPYPDRRLGYASARYLSPLGEIRASWQYQGDGLIFDITVPCNTEATLILPDQRTMRLTPGTYQFTI